VQLVVARATAPLSLTLRAAAVAEGHWSGGLPLLFPMDYEVSHALLGD
jgi:hypothetical protein